MDGSVGGAFDCPWGTCVSAFVSETEGVYVLFEEAAFRIWQLTGSSDGVHGFLQSRPDTFGDMVDLADMVIGGMIVEQVG